LILYTEEPKTDDRGWWPRREKSLVFQERSAILADFFLDG